jgi:RHS repeat-associated protein
MKVAIIGLMSILCLAPSAGWAQFNPVKPSSAGGTPIPPGSIAYPGQNPTTQFNGQAFITPFGPGTTALGAYDAVAWFKITAEAPYYGIPIGWVGTSSTMGYCHPQAGGSGWWVDLQWPPGGTPVSLSGGTPCQSPSPVPIASRLAIHYVGQPNGPEQPADPPAEAENPGNSCRARAGDPCDTKTGLYYQTDTDITVPDVMPITMTRTYRTKDTASRVFGIGASHPYDQYMLRDDLCTAVRVILPDGAYIHFTRTSGTNCLNSTLQHTSTQMAFYAATMVWDQVYQRYRLTFKDGTEWRFSEYGALVAMLDRNGNATTLTRALDGGLTGNLTKITSPSGRYLTLAYDASNRVTQVTDILGRQIVYTYDASGRLWKVTNAAGGIAEYTYDASHRLLTNKEPNGNTHVTNAYDANGRVATQTQADGTTYQFAYTLDGSGNVTQTDVTDPRGIIKRFVFNSAGLTASITDAYGQPETETTTYEWQANTNLLLSVTDALNRKTAYTYDAKGNTLTVTKLATTANAVTTTMTYVPVYNQVATVTDPLSHTTTFAYDAKGNLTTITNALSKTTTITVNNAGQPLTITDPLSNVTTFTYELGDLVKVKDPLNRETQRILDAAGRLRNVTNPLGQKTLYTPDALDRITQLVDAINGTTAFTYDANSNLLTVTDAKSQQTVYTYNNMNRTATRKDPLLKTETYTYDNNGNVATVTDRKSQVTTYTYDLLNRKTKATYQDGTSTTYTYDAGNRLTQIQEKDAGNTVTATITRTYDGLDRLTQEVTAQGTLTYTYDNASRRATMTVAGQPTVNYTYDNANRLTQITQGANLVTIGYDDADRRASLTLPNGNSVVYAYNAASELLSLTYKQGATVIGDLTYTYDAAGNRIKQGGAFARRTIPPALATASYNANNQQTVFGSNTETYDLNGNLSTVTDASGTATYTWNARNQLVAITATGFAASFQYDSFGRRTGKTIQGVTTNFVYDGYNPVQEKSGATVTANLLTGLGIDEFLTRTDGAGTRGLLTDALGSTVALGDGTGTIQTQYTYEPFGYVSQTGAANTSSYTYTGREDDGSGLYYYRARYYHSRLQRFISEDPTGFAGGDANLYRYVGGNPLTWRDPLGQFVAVLPFLPPLIGSATVAGAAITAAIGTAGSIAWGILHRDPPSDDPDRSTKPKNCPSGTKPIDQFPDLDRDDIHKIKKGLGARPDDWVGITPDGNVITGGSGGQAVNQGPYKDYLPWKK